MKRAIFFLTLLLFGCGSSGDEKAHAEFVKSRSPEANSKGETTIRSYYSNGKTKSEVVYKNGKRNGIARSYAEDGSLVFELPYVNDLREGISKRYYAGGKTVAESAEYKANKLNGMLVKYHVNGKLQSEAKYVDDYPCTGLKEYLLDGTLKKKYPSIEISVSDKPDANGAKTLYIRLSEKVRDVKFYRGNLPANGCFIADDLYYLRMNELTKTAVMPYYQTSGEQNEINIIAVFETTFGNTGIIQRRYRP